MKNFIAYLLILWRYFVLRRVCDVSIQKSIDSFLQEFKQYLSQQKITITSAAKFIEVTRAHLSKVIHGKASPSIELLEKMESFIRGDFNDY